MKKEKQMSPVQAPFDFIALNDKIADPEADVLKAFEAGSLHRVPLANGHCGHISVTWEFDGPFLTAGHQTPPQREQPGKAGPLMLGNDPVIPGASLRGMIRSTLEIAALGRLEQVDRHKRFGIRDFNHKLFDPLTRPQVRGGWLTPVSSGCNPSEIVGAVLTPCEIYRIRIRSLPTVGEDGGKHVDWLADTRLMERYERCGMSRQPNPRDLFSNTFDFISADPPNISAGPPNEVRPAPIGSMATIRGTYVFSDCLPSLRRSVPEERALLIAELNAQDGVNAPRHKKKYEHVFGPPNADEIPLPPEVWNLFLTMNCSPSQSRPQPQGNWQKLRPVMVDGGRIPVFWIGDAGKPKSIEIGLVRVFKRAHTMTVGDKIPTTHNVDPDTKPDMVSALFGLVRDAVPDKGEPVALKSRVAFGMARAEDGCWRTAPFPTTIQAQPKPSYGPFYLRGKVKDWSAAEATIAGRKRIKAFRGTVDEIRELVGNPSGILQNNPAADPEKWRTQSDLTFLFAADGRALRFTSEIRLHNVTEAEIGALIWALTLGGDKELRHSLGRARGQGAGQVRVTAFQLNVKRNDGGDAATDYGAYVTAFTDHMRKTDPSWPNVQPVQELLDQSHPATNALRPRTYMSVSEYMSLRREVYDDGHGDNRPDRLLEP